MKKREEILMETEKEKVILNIDWSNGYCLFPNSIMYNGQLSNCTKAAMIRIIEDSCNSGLSKIKWTKEMIAKKYKFSDYKIRKIIKELTAEGYCYYNNDGKYEFYISPLCNPYFGKNKKNKKKSKGIITDSMLNQYLELHGYEHPEYKICCEESIYNGGFKHISIPTLFESKEYINQNLLIKSIDNINELYTLCWNTIVKGITYNDNAFNTFRYSTSGEKMANMNEKIIKKVYETFISYNESRTKIIGINKIRKIIINDVEISLKKLFLYDCSIVISNYVKLGFLDKKLPNIKELLGLYKTLSEYPDLLYLNCDEVSYRLLDYFFNENQNRYKR